MKAEAAKQTVIIVDDVQDRRNEMYGMLRNFALPIPLSSIDDLMTAWPKEAWLMVYDTGPQLERVMQEMGRVEASNPVIAYSQNACVSAAISALHCGAVNFVGWPCDEAALKGAMLDVAELATARARRRTAKWSARARIERLTPRELEVIMAASEGLSNKEIAQKLSISPRTAEIHRARAYVKLDVRNVCQATRVMIEAEVETDCAMDRATAA